MKTNVRSFSIIMTVYDQARELEENLPAFLQQEYGPGEYQVIVVDESSTDRTPDVLKLFKSEYPHLYSTFLPKPNRLIIRRKLAFHLGVKASKNEWIIFTKINRKPMATDILKAIADALDDTAEVTLGYAVKKGTPAGMIAWFQDLCDKISADPEWIDYMENGNLLTVLTDRTEAFTKTVVDEVESTISALKAVEQISADYKYK